jgi:hypothetical protein
VADFDLPEVETAERESESRSIHNFFASFGLALGYKNPRDVLSPFTPLRYLP